MEKKDRLNLNPEADEIKAQEENAASVSDAINVHQTNLPEENQDVLLKNEMVENVKEVESNNIDESTQKTFPLSDTPETTEVSEVTEVPETKEAAETIEESVATEVPKTIAAAESIEESLETESIVATDDTIKESVTTEVPETIAAAEPVPASTAPEAPVEIETIASIEAPLDTVQVEVKNDTSAHELIHQELLAMDIGTVVEEEEDDDEDVEDDSLMNYESFNRKQLVELLEKVVAETDISLIKKKVANVRIEFEKKNKAQKEEAYKKYISEGGEAEAYAPADDVLELRFRMAFEKFKQSKARFNEEQEKIKITNLALKNQILDNLRSLIDTEEPLKRINDDFKALQDKWKTIGMVPKNEVTSLWNNYHFLVEKFYDKVRIIKELKDLDLRKNLESKVAICEKTEDLLINFNLADSFKKLQQLHEEWKEIGPVPLDKKDEVWERFKAASDQINDRRREYYTGMQEEQNSNYAAKVALCESAEKLIVTNIESVKQWQDITDQLNELLKVWKSVGPAPRKVNDEIWIRFKGYLDTFFSNKKEYFTKLKDQQLNNFNLKLNLCVNAEALKNSNDWAITTKELIRLQKEWKEIGPVPRKQSDKIWKRFRAACDEFFNLKSEFFKNIHEQEDNNLKLKMDLLKLVQEFELSEDRNANIETLKDYQRQWMEIGHVPIKDKDRLQNEFRTAINKHFDKLKVNTSEVSSNNYRAKYESLKEQPEATRIVSRERAILQTKMAELQEDIKIWENNIGFFANSKNTNLFKVEFEKKIEKAKEELKSIEAKIKILRSV